MSNEVNQAYLRAYIKNRVASRPIPNVSTPLPAKSALNASGDTETTYRRAEMGTPGAPASRQLAPAMKPVPAKVPSPSARPADPLPLEPEEVRGVWSPLGAERGMKGAGVFRTQPAVVVNGAPTTIVHAASPSQASPVQASPVQANPVQSPVASPNKPIPRSVTSPAHPFPSIRIDSGHGKGVSHLPPAPAVAVPPAPLPPTPVPMGRTSGAKPTLESHGGVQTETLDASARSASREPAATSSRMDRKDATKATTELPLPVAFQPSWEVDKFFWPEVLLQLEKSNRSAFDQIGYHLRLANQDGLRVMAITSGERGVGRSTVAMHLARCAAAAGLQVGLMDADTCYPSLIDQLRLDMEHGWQDCLFENVPLEEVAVRSVEDGITVYPLTSLIAAQPLHANLNRIARIVKRISSVHDIVFLDSNRLNLEQRDLVGISQECVVDAAVLVVDTELSIREKVDTANSILQGMGVASIGMVENFHA